jgi:hypothetical protein
VWLGIFCRSSRLLGRLTLLFDFCFLFRLNGYDLLFSFANALPSSSYDVRCCLRCKSHPYATARQLRLLGLSVLFMSDSTSSTTLFVSYFHYVILFSRLILLVEDPSSSDTFVRFREVCRIDVLMVRLILDHGPNRMFSFS